MLSNFLRQQMAFFMISVELTSYLAFAIIMERAKSIEFYAGEIPNVRAEKIEWKDVKQINNIEYVEENTTESVAGATEVRLW